MGIINVTPDSFSDGGLFLDHGSAVSHGVSLASEGAHILDIGGESTRPGAEPVTETEELRRVIPVVEGLADTFRSQPAHPRISIDTSKAPVAKAALEAGAALVNDISALRADPDMAQTLASSGAECCLMHMQGLPRTMQQNPRYDDVVDEVKAFLEERLAFAVHEGVHEQRIMLDPGIGFGKTVEHNLTLLRRLDELVAIGRPIVIGTSRKSFLGRIAAVARDVTALPADERLAGTIATNVMAFERGANIFRVHDIAPVRDALATAAATLSGTWTAKNRMSPTSG